MINNLIDYRAQAALKKQTIKHFIDSIQPSVRKPCLAVVLVGDDSASRVYINSKQKACKDVGMKSLMFHLESNYSQQALLDVIRKLNEDKNVDGILVQLPLPNHINSALVLDTIEVSKDVDGFSDVNSGALFSNKPLLRLCTPKGVMTLLHSLDITLQGLDAVVVGASNIVGRPMAIELLNVKCTVTICHSKTKNLPQKIAQADLLVVGVGIANFIKGEWVKSGAVVIDVGINRLENGKLVGDVDFDTTQPKASWITPVPGGVGPMTIVELLDNTLIAYQNHINLD